MAGTVIVIIVVVIVALLIYASTKPNSFRFHRSLTMSAPPEKIFPYINDFHAWGTWSPYEKLDPGMQRTYGGAASGLGATYAYEGNNKVGAGRMEITDSVAPSKMVADLQFIRPFAARNTAEFTLVPTGTGTNVTWAMHGPNTYMNKVMGTVLNMDRLVGNQFEEGLANLKAIVEK